MTTTFYMYKAGRNDGLTNRQTDRLFDFIMPPFRGIQMVSRYKIKLFEMRIGVKLVK
jgi:hypothetical protein